MLLPAPELFPLSLVPFPGAATLPWHPWVLHARDHDATTEEDTTKTFPNGSISPRVLYFFLILLLEITIFSSVWAG